MTMMMRRVFALLIVLAMATEAWAWKPLFVGHRGCNIGVENTAEAFRNGVNVYRHWPNCALSNTPRRVAA